MYNIVDLLLAFWQSTCLDNKGMEHPEMRCSQWTYMDHSHILGELLPTTTVAVLNRLV
jgi:hypothetical protein